MNQTIRPFKKALRTGEPSGTAATATMAGTSTSTHRLSPPFSGMNSLVEGVVVFNDAAAFGRDIAEENDPRWPEPEKHFVVAPNEQLSSSGILLRSHR